MSYNDYSRYNQTKYGTSGNSRPISRGASFEPRGIRGRNLDQQSGSGGTTQTPPPSSPRKQKKGGTLNQERRKHRALPIILILIIAVFVAWLVLFAAKVDGVLHSFPTAEQIELDEAVKPAASWGVQPVNVLLLGSDARVDDPSIGARTDAIVLAHVDPNLKTVSMVSLPRDTLIESTDYGTYKLNAAYAYEGPDRAVHDVEELCGVKIDHCILVDFTGLAGLVDALGGIDVVVDETIDNPKAGDVVVPAGLQHINGAQALVMSRDRDYVDGDYTRQSNQRKVISGIMHRILNMAPWEMPGAVEGCAECVSTDSSTGTLGLLLLAARMKMPWANMQLKTTVLPSAPADINGVSYVIADKAGTKELMLRFDNGGDIEDPVISSSIDQDIVAARGW